MIKSTAVIVCLLLFNILILQGQKKEDTEQFLEKIKQIMERIKETQQDMAKQKLTKEEKERRKRKARKQLLEKLAIPYIPYKFHNIIIDISKKTFSKSPESMMSTVDNAELINTQRSLSYLRSKISHLLKDNPRFVPFKFQELKKFLKRESLNENAGDIKTTDFNRQRNPAMREYIDSVHEWLLEIHNSSRIFWKIIYQVFIEDDENFLYFSGNICKGVNRDFMFKLSNEKIRRVSAPFDTYKMAFHPLKITGELTLFSVTGMDSRNFRIWARKIFSPNRENLDLCEGLIVLDSYGRYLLPPPDELDKGDVVKSIIALLECVDKYYTSSPQQCDKKRVENLVEKSVILFKRYFRFANNLFKKAVLPLYIKTLYYKSRGKDIRELTNNLEDLLNLLIYKSVSKERLKEISTILRSFKFPSFKSDTGHNINIEDVEKRMGCQLQSSNILSKLKQEIEDAVTKFISELDNNITSIRKYPDLRIKIMESALCGDLDRDGSLGCTDEECKKLIGYDLYVCGIDALFVILEKFFYQEIPDILKLNSFTNLLTVMSNYEDVRREFLNSPEKFNFCEKLLIGVLLYNTNQWELLPQSPLKLIIPVVYYLVSERGKVMLKEFSLLSHSKISTIKLKKFELYKEFTMAEIFNSIFWGCGVAKEFNQYDILGFLLYANYFLAKCGGKVSSLKEFLNKEVYEQSEGLSEEEREEIYTYLRCIYNSRDLLKCINETQLFDSSKYDMGNNYTRKVLINFFRQKMGLEKLEFSRWDEIIATIARKVSGKFFWNFIEQLECCKTYKCFKRTNISFLTYITWALCNIEASPIDVCSANFSEILGKYTDIFTSTSPCLLTNSGDNFVCIKRDSQECKDEEKTTCEKYVSVLTLIKNRHQEEFNIKFEPWKVTGIVQNTNSSQFNDFKLSVETCCKKCKNEPKQETTGVCESVVDNYTKEEKCLNSHCYAFPVGENMYAEREKFIEGEGRQLKMILPHIKNFWEQNISVDNIKCE
ncbi:MAG: hypothetical protein ACK4NF_05435 [Planctomycetota bacterium]